MLYMLSVISVWRFVGGKNLLWVGTLKKSTPSGLIMYSETESYEILSKLRFIGKGLSLFVLVIPSNVQDLLLALFSEITPEMLQGPYGMPHIQVSLIQDKHPIYSSISPVLVKVFFFFFSFYKVYNQQCWGGERYMPSKTYCWWFLWATSAITGSAWRAHLCWGLNWGLARHVLYL